MTATDLNAAPTGAPPVPAARRAIGVGLALLSGGAVAVQSRINGELAARLHDGIAAAVISFGSGLVLLAIAVPALPAGRRGLRNIASALRTRQLRPWHLLGGVCGGLFVAGQGLAVPSLGVAVFTVALVAGQSTSSLAVDHAGLGPGRPEPLTRTRVAGAALAIGAVLVAVWPRLGNPSAAGLAVLPALAGVGIAWQQAVNGKVRVAAGAALPPALVNFAAGTAVLVLSFAISLGIRGWPAGPLPTEPLLYVGGALGIVFIAIAASVVRYTGVLLLGLSMVAGQVSIAVLLDLLAPTDGRPGGWTYAGAALTLVAVALAAAPAGTVRRKTL